MASPALHIPSPHVAKAKLWPAMIFVLLGLNVAIVALTAVLASRNATTRVEPDYDIKGLHWDATKAHVARMHAIGWHAAPSMTMEGDASLVLTDRVGAPLSNAAVRVTLFHHAAPREQVSMQMEETAPGWYVARCNIARPGQWHIRFVVQHAGTTLDDAMDFETTWSVK